jgi:hypothetical protein
MRNPFTASLNAAAALVDRRFDVQVEPWTTSDLESVVWADVLGVSNPDTLPTTRSVAMAVPAVARARHLIAGTIAKLPLEAFRGGEVVDPLPYWLQGTDGQLGDLTPAAAGAAGVMPQSPWWRMLWTIDDHLFHGLSVWLITRRDPADDRPTRMVRIPYTAWNLDDEGRVTDRDGHPFDPAALVVIPGPHEGLLNYAAATIRTAGALERIAADVARHPFRLELHQTSDVTLTPTERAALVGEARRALNANDGVLFTNSAIETKDHPLDSGDLLIAGRNASALDVARHASMPAAMIDAVATGASLEYQSTVARNQQWIDYGLSLYTEAVTSRLSMDDVVPQGQRVDFNMTDLTTPVASPTGPATED